MIPQPLEVNVGETYSAFITGERMAYRHPSTVLGSIPTTASDHLVYDLRRDGCDARVMVSTQKRQVTGHVGSGLFSRTQQVTNQDVLIAVKGYQSAVVRGYLDQLAQTLEVTGQAKRTSGYARQLTDFLGGSGEAQQAVDKVLNPIRPPGVNPFKPKKSKEGRAPMWKRRF